MTAIVTEYTYVFDDVQFALDVRAARVKRELTQLVVAQALGHTSPTNIVQIEQANYSNSLTFKDFLKLCQLFDLHPEEYFDLQRASTIDMFKKFG